MISKRSFIKQFFKHRQMVGSIRPSSRFLGEKMLENIDFIRSKSLIELGPGCGVFTDMIIDRMAPDASLLVFELNDEFYDSLNTRINDPRVTIIHDSAEHLEKYIHDGKKIDAVVSSLPLMVFPETVRDNVVNVSHKVLKSAGIYMQFQYSLQSKKLLKFIFNDVSIKFTTKNFPPAFIYTCRKK